MTMCFKKPLKLKKKKEKLKSASKTWSIANFQVPSIDRNILPYMVKVGYNSNYQLSITDQLFCELQEFFHKVVPFMF